MKKEYVLFKGKATPMESFVGTAFYPSERKDRFGILRKGEYRLVRVDTKGGQVCLPFKFGNKNIEIIVREI